MNELLTSVTTGIFVSVILCGVCIYLGAQERDPALRSWALAWLVFALRGGSALLSAIYPESTALHSVNHAGNLVFGLLLLRGVRHWVGAIDRPFVWPLFVLGGLVWELAVQAVEMHHAWASIPSSVLAAGMAAWGGVLMLRSARAQGNLGAWLVALGLVLWAFHSLDHPLSWETVWFLPWDYEIDAFFTIYFAMAIWLLYYGESRQVFLTQQASLSSLLADMPTLFWRMEGARQRHVIGPDRQIHGQSQPPRNYAAWPDSVHPEDFHRYGLACATAVERRETFSLEYRLRDGDGEYRWVKDDGVPTFDSAGAFTGYVGVATDITEQKENERRLAEREQRLNTLFQGASDAIFVATAEGRVVDVNDQACRSTGYTREELLNFRVQDIDASPTAARDHQEFQSQKPHNRTSRYLSNHRRKDGTLIPVEVRINILETSDGPLCIGIARDLSERVAEETRFTQILSTAIDGFMVFNYEGRLLEVNPAAANSLGYTIPEMQCLSVCDIDRTMTQEEVRRRTQTVIELGQMRFEAVHWKKDGTPIDVEVSVSHSAALPGQIMCFTRDITERKLAEARLRKSESFLRRSQSVGHIGSWELELASGKVTCSDEFLKIFRLPRDFGEITLAEAVACVDPGDWRALKRDFARSLRASESGGACEIRIRGREGRQTRIINTRYEHVFDDEGTPTRTTGVIQDVTFQRREERISAARLRLMDYARHNHSAHDLLQTFLDEAERITDSVIGFFHFVEPDGVTLSLQAWSTNTLTNMCSAEGEGQHYPISQAGVWADCAREGRPVIHNDYASLSNKRGLPVGHAPIVRQLVVPVSRSGKIMAILGVGNKPEDYTQQDVDTIEYLADIAWDTVVRMRAEEALQASEAKFSRAFWNAPFQMTIGTVEDGRCLDANDAFYRTTGYPPEAVLGRTSTEIGFLKESQRSRLREHIETYGEARELELELRRADGSAMTALYSGVIVEVAGEPRLLSTAVDITERKRAEEAVTRQNRAITLSRNIATAFLTAAPEETFSAMTRVVREALESGIGFFGYLDEKGELVCPGMPAAFREADTAGGQDVRYPPDSWSGIWGAALRSKGTVISTTAPDLPLGNLRPDNAIATPLLHHGAATGVFVLANRLGSYGAFEQELLENAAHQAAPLVRAYLEHERKERERVQLEAQLRQSQKMEAIGQLTGGVAHDFNNLLHAILSCTDLIREGIVPIEDADDLLGQIADAATRAAKLVSQLLLFSRRQIMRPVPLDLNEVTPDLMKMLGRIIGEHVQIQWHPGPHSRRIRADRGMVEQVLTNLCVNARDAMPDGGVITLTTGQETVLEGHRACNPDLAPGEYVVLRVRDSGHGIDESIINRIFEPFFTTKEVGKGTGLGLATVYGIVRQHGGAVCVDSGPGLGTTFTTYWPVAVTGEEAGDTADAPEPVALPGGTETILLAEDDPLVRGLTRQILENAGYTVLAVENGTDAVELLHTHPEGIALAILDVVMPGMSGHAAFLRMKEIRPDLPVLYASGYTEEALHERFVLDQDVKLIQKPYNRKALLIAVRDILAIPPAGP